MGIENEYEEKTILTTGGAGCTGTNLCRKLAESGARVIILDDLSSAYEWNTPKAKNEEHCIRKARLRLPFSRAFRKPVMERLGRELQECLQRVGCN